MAAEAFSRDGGLAGLSTGLTDLDQKLGGLHPSDLLILAGRPSMGKSGLAANIAYNVARNYAWELDPSGAKKTVNGGVVAFFSLEMSAEQLAMRLLADASGVSSDRLRKARSTSTSSARSATPPSRSAKRRSTSTRPAAFPSPSSPPAPAG
jgi:replicative DNA helicase